MQDKPTAEQFKAYAREQAEQALAAIEDDRATDIDVMASLELALMAASMWLDGDAARTIKLEPADVIEYLAEPECICPPDLVARGGFKGGCPVHG